MRIPLELAARIGCTSDYLRKINRGVRRPGVEMAKKIMLASGGKITLRDLRPDLAELSALVTRE
jgi:DNA-binding transcriptional regulator YdaS (Cro superfamily)